MSEYVLAYQKGAQSWVEVLGTFYPDSGRFEPSSPRRTKRLFGEKGLAVDSTARDKGYYWCEHAVNEAKSQSSRFPRKATSVLRATVARKWRRGAAVLRSDVVEGTTTFDVQKEGSKYIELSDGSGTFWLDAENALDDKPLLDESRSIPVYSAPDGVTDIEFQRGPGEFVALPPGVEPIASGFLDWTSDRDFLERVVSELEDAYGRALESRAEWVTLAKRRVEQYTEFPNKVGSEVKEELATRMLKLTGAESAREDALREAKVEAAHILAQAVKSRDSLREDAQRLEEQILRLRGELKASILRELQIIETEPEAAARLSIIRSALMPRAEEATLPRGSEVSDRIQKVEDEMRKVLVRLDGFQTDQDIQRVSPLWSALPPSSDLKKNLTPKLIAKSLHSRMRIRGVNPACAPHLLSCLACRRLPIVCGPAARTTIRALSEVLAGGRVVYQAISCGTFDCSDLLQSRMVAALLRQAVANQDHLFVLALAGIDQAPTGSYLVPLLDGYSEREAFLPILGGFSAWPNNVLLVGTVDGGSPIVPLSSGTWERSYFIEPEELDIDDSPALKSTDLQTTAWLESAKLALEADICEELKHLWDQPLSLSTKPLMKSISAFGIDEAGVLAVRRGLIYPRLLSLGHSVEDAPPSLISLAGQGVTA